MLWILTLIPLALIALFVVAALQPEKHYDVTCECRSCGSWNRVAVPKGETPEATVANTKCGGCYRKTLRQIG